MARPRPPRAPRVSLLHLRLALVLGVLFLAFAITTTLAIATVHDLLEGRVAADAARLEHEGRLALQFMYAASAVVFLMGLWGSIRLWRDLSERDRLREALEAGEQFANAVFDHAPVGIQVFGPDGTSQRMNQAQCDLLGLPSRETGIGVFNPLKDPLMVASGESRYFRRAYEGHVVDVPDTGLVLGAPGNRWPVERRALRLETLLFPIRDEAGAIRAVVSFARDVTDRRAAEQERMALERRAQHAHKLESLGVLAGGIAHDLNNVLQTVVGAAELLEEDCAGLPTAPHLVRRILQSADRATGLARQMLAYSGKGRFVVQRFDLVTLLRGMRELLAASVPPGVCVDVEIDGPGPHPIEADVSQIEQAIVQLVLNAGEAAPDGGRVTVRLGTCTATHADFARCYGSPGLPPGPYAAIEIADSGAGMDETVQARAFEPFFSTKFAGRGLGLPAVFGCVRANGGAVALDSRVGAGTTARVLLPYAPDAETGEPRQAELFAPADAAGVALVVDDEPLVCEVATELLSRLGWQAVTASDGVQALEVFRARPDLRLVLLDLTMPGMSGEAVYAEMLRHRPDVRVVLMSALPEALAAERLGPSRPAGVLAKPFGMDALRPAVLAAVAT